jgi:leucyl/phenylalanyl-tRNA--protein transferase
MLGDLRSEIKDYLSKYISGQFMNYDDDNGHFWEHRPTERGIVELNDATVELAQKKLHSDVYTFRINERFNSVLRDLGNPEIKTKSWLRGKAIEIYKDLFKHKFAKSYEAYKDDLLCGAILGIDLNPVFVAETMYFVPGQDGASKACLAFMVQDLKSKGYQFIDTQVVHDASHPISRIGEKPISLQSFHQRMSVTLSHLNKI